LRNVRDIHTLGGVRVASTGRPGLAWSRTDPREKLRSAASDTADKIEKMHGRFAAVGSALTAWVQPLETAQKDTLDALHAAQQAVAEQNANKPPDGSAPEHPTDAQKQAEHTRAQNYSAAGTALAAARTKVRRRARRARPAGEQDRGQHQGLAARRPRGRFLAVGFVAAASLIGLIAAHVGIAIARRSGPGGTDDRRRRVGGFGTPEPGRVGLPLVLGGIRALTCAW